MLEVCVDSYESVVAAAEGGAQRIELCSSLSEGGLTPSLSLLKYTKKHYPNLHVFPMLRPFAGPFVYSNHDMEIIFNDIDDFVKAGADGFVFGALTYLYQQIWKIDEQKSSAVRQHCTRNNKLLPLTFHRAFDLTDPNDAHENLLKIQHLGYTRLLTSGFRPNILLGLNNICELIKFQQTNTIGVDPAFIIMPGSGINVENVNLILNKTKCREFHSSAKQLIKESRQLDFCFGQRIQTDRQIVQRLVEIGKTFF